MKKSALFCFTLSSIAFNVAYATNFEISNSKDPSQTEINSSSAVDNQILQADLLRKQKLTNKNKETQHISRFTGKELKDNPALLEKLFLDALISSNNNILPTYIKLYEQVPTADRSLIEWANALLLRDKNLNNSVAAYRSLQTNFPDNDFIRFQLAETLFYNQEYEAAKTQFERLRASKNVVQQDIQVFDSYIQAINNKEQWNFSFGATFLNDKNLSNSAPQGTKVILPNGNSITYSSPRQTGQGISAWIGADKQWTLSHGKYIAFDTSLTSKYYWDNKPYNDVNAHVGLGLGYSDARFNIAFTPYIDKRWYAGGANSGKSLKQYSNTYGAQLGLSYWLTQNLKYSFAYDFGYDMYDKARNRELYNGSTHSLTNSLTYLKSATQYWSLGIDTMKKSAKDKTNAYDRLGARLTWGQEWPLGISTSTTLGIGKRYYKEASFFGKKQKNDEYSASVSLWHRDIHYAGFTPKLSWNYTKTKSNIAIYSYDKNQILLNVSKSF